MSFHFGKASGEPCGADGRCYLRRPTRVRSLVLAAMLLAAMAATLPVVALAESDDGQLTTLIVEVEGPELTVQPLGDSPQLLTVRLRTVDSQGAAVIARPTGKLVFSGAETFFAVLSTDSSPTVEVSGKGLVKLPIVADDWVAGMLQRRFMARPLAGGRQTITVAFVRGAVQLDVAPANTRQVSALSFQPEPSAVEVVGSRHSFDLVDPQPDRDFCALVVAGGESGDSCAALQSDASGYKVSYLPAPWEIRAGEDGDANLSQSLFSPPIGAGEEACLRIELREEYELAGFSVRYRLDFGVSEDRLRVYYGVANAPEKLLWQEWAAPLGAWHTASGRAEEVLAPDRIDSLHFCYRKQTELVGGAVGIANILLEEYFYPVEVRVEVQESVVQIDPARPESAIIRLQAVDRLGRPAMDAVAGELILSAADTDFSLRLLGRSVQDSATARSRLAKNVPLATWSDGVVEVVAEFRPPVVGATTITVEFRSLETRVSGSSRDISVIDFCGVAVSAGSCRSLDAVSDDGAKLRFEPAESPWLARAEPAGGPLALYSPPLADGVQSCLHLQLRAAFYNLTGLSFDYSLSSEQERDFLEVFVGREGGGELERIARLSGEVNWSSAHYTITPNSERPVSAVAFCYRKDGSGSAGRDRVAIDAIAFTGLLLAELTVESDRSSLLQAAVGELVQTQVTVTARGAFGEPMAPKGLTLEAVDSGGAAVTIATTATLVFDSGSGRAQLTVQLLPVRGSDTTLRLTVRGADTATLIHAEELPVIAVEVPSLLEVLAPSSLRQQGQYWPLRFDVQVRAVGSKGSPWQPPGLVLQHRAVPGAAIDYSTAALSFESGLATVQVTLLPPPGEDMTAVFSVGGAMAAEFMVLRDAEVPVVAAQVVSTLTLTVLGPSVRTATRKREFVDIDIQLRMEGIGKPLTERRYNVMATYTNVSGYSYVFYPVVVPSENNYGTYTLSALTFGLDNRIHFEVLYLPSGVTVVGDPDTVQILVVPVLKSLSLTLREGSMTLLPSRGRATANYVVELRATGSDGQPFDLSFEELRLMRTDTVVYADDLVGTAILAQLRLSAVPGERGVGTGSLAMTLSDPHVRGYVELELISVVADDERPAKLIAPLTVPVLRAQELATLTVELVAPMLYQPAPREAVQAQIVVTARGQYGEVLVPNDMLRLVHDPLPGGAVLSYDGSERLRFDDRGVATATVSITPVAGEDFGLQFGVTGQPATVEVIHGRLEVVAAAALQQLSLSVVQGEEQLLDARGSAIADYTLRVEAIDSVGQPFPISWSERELLARLIGGSAVSYVPGVLRGVPGQVGVATASLTVALGAEDGAATLELGLSGPMGGARAASIRHSSAVLTVRRRAELGELEVRALVSTAYQTVAGEIVLLELLVMARGLFGEPVMPPARTLRLVAESVEGGGSVTFSGQGSLRHLLFRRMDGTTMVRAKIVLAPGVDARLVVGVAGQSSAVRVISDRVTVIAAGALSTVHLTVLDPSPRQVLSGSDRAQFALQVSFEQKGQPLSDVPLELAAFLGGEAKPSSVAILVMAEHAGSPVTGVLELSLGPVARESTVHFTVAGLPGYVTVLRPEPVRVTLVPELSELKLSVVAGGDQQLAVRGRAVGDYVLQVQAIGSDGLPFAVPWSVLNVVAVPTEGSVESYAAVLTALPGRMDMATAELSVVLGEADGAATLELGLSGFAALDQQLPVRQSSAVIQVRRVSELGELEIDVLSTTVQQTVAGALTRVPLRVIARGLFGEVFVPPFLSLSLTAESLTSGAAVGFSGYIRAGLLNFDLATGVYTGFAAVRPAPGVDAELVIGVTGQSSAVRVVTGRAVVIAAGALSTVQLTVLDPSPRQVLSGSDRAQIELQVSFEQKGQPLRDVPLILSGLLSGEAEPSSVVTRVTAEYAGSPVTGVLELSLGPTARNGLVHFAVAGLPRYVTVLRPEPVRVELVPALSTLSISVVTGQEQRLAPRGRVVADYVLQVAATGSDGRPIAVPWSELSLVAVLSEGSAVSYIPMALSAVPEQVGVATAVLTVTLGEGDRAATLELGLSGLAMENRGVEIMQSSAVVTVQRLQGLDELTVETAVPMLQQTVAGERLRTVVTVTARGAFDEPVAPVGLVLEAADSTDIELLFASTATLYFDADSGRATAMIELLPLRGVDTTLRLTVGGAGTAAAVRPAELRVSVAEVLGRLEVLAPAELRQSGPYLPLRFEVQVRATGSKGSPWQPEGLVLQHRTASGAVVSHSTASLLFASGLASVAIELLPPPGEDMTAIFTIGGELAEFVLLGPAEVAVVAAEVLRTVKLAVLGSLLRKVDTLDEQTMIEGRLDMKGIGKALSERRFTVKAYFSEPPGRVLSHYPVVVRDENSYGHFTFMFALQEPDITVRFEVIGLPQEVSLIGHPNVVRLKLTPVLTRLVLSVQQGELGLAPPRGPVTANYEIEVRALDQNGQPIEISFAGLDLSATLIAGSAESYVPTALNAVPGQVGVATAALPVELGEGDRMAILQLGLSSAMADDERLDVPIAPLAVELLRLPQLAELTLQTEMSTLYQTAENETLPVRIIVTAQDPFGEPFVPTEALRLMVMESLEGGVEPVFNSSEQLHFDYRGVATVTVTFTPAPGMNGMVLFGVTEQSPAVTVVPLWIEVVATAVLRELRLSALYGNQITFGARGIRTKHIQLRAEGIGSDGRLFAIPWSELELMVALAGGSAKSYVLSELSVAADQPGLATAELTAVLGEDDGWASLELNLSSVSGGDVLGPIRANTLFLGLYRIVALDNVLVEVDVSTLYQTAVGERVALPLTVRGLGVFGGGVIPTIGDHALVASLEPGGSVVFTGADAVPVLGFTSSKPIVRATAYITPYPGIDTVVHIGVTTPSHLPNVGVIPARVAVVAAGALTTVQLTVLDPSPRQVFSESDRFQIALQVSFEQNGAPLADVPFTLVGTVNDEDRRSSSVVVTVANEGSPATGILELSLSAVARETMVHFDVVGLPEYVTVLRPEPLSVTFVPVVSELRVIILTHYGLLPSQGGATRDYDIATQAFGTSGQPIAVPWSEMSADLRLIRGSAEEYYATELVEVTRGTEAILAMRVVMGETDRFADIEIGLSGFVPTSQGVPVTLKPAVLSVRRVPQLAELTVETEGPATVYQSAAGEQLRVPLRVTARNEAGEAFVPSPGALTLVVGSVTGGGSVSLSGTAELGALSFDPDTGTTEPGIAALITPALGVNAELSIAVSGQSPSVRVVPAQITVVAAGALSVVRLAVQDPSPREVLSGSERVQIEFQLSFEQLGQPLRQLPFTVSALLNGEAQSSAPPVHVTVADEDSPATGTLEVSLGPTALGGTVDFAVIDLPEYVTVLKSNPVRLILAPALSTLSLSVLPSDGEDLPHRGRVVTNQVLQVEATGSDGRPIAVSWSDLMVMVTVSDGAVESYTSAVLNGVPGQPGMARADIAIVLAEEHESATLELALSGFAPSDRGVEVMQQPAVLRLQRAPGLARLTVETAVSTLFQTAADVPIRTRVTVTALNTDGGPEAPEGLFLEAVGITGYAVTFEPAASLNFDADSGVATVMMELLPLRGADAIFNLTVRGVADSAVAVIAAELEIIAVEVLRFVQFRFSENRRQLQQYSPVHFTAFVDAFGSKNSRMQPEGLVLQHSGLPPGASLHYSTATLVFESGRAATQVSLLPAPGEDLTVMFTVGGEVPPSALLFPREALVVAAEVLSTVTLTVLRNSVATVNALRGQASFGYRMTMQGIGKPLTERRFTIEIVYNHPPGRVDTFHPVVLRDGNDSATFGYSVQATTRTTEVTLRVPSLPPGVTTVREPNSVQLLVVPVFDRLSLTVGQGELQLLPARGRATATYLIEVQALGSDGRPYEIPLEDLGLSASLTTGSAESHVPTATMPAALAAGPGRLGMASAELTVVLGEQDRMASLQLGLLSLSEENPQFGEEFVPLAVDVQRIQELAELSVEAAVSTLQQGAPGESVQTQLLVRARGVFGEAVVPNGVLRLTTAFLEGDAEVVFADSGLLQFDDRGVAMATVSITPAVGADAVLRFGVAGQLATVSVASAALEVKAATVLRELYLDVVAGDELLSARGRVIADYTLRAVAIDADGQPYPLLGAGFDFALTLLAGSAEIYDWTPPQAIDGRVGAVTAELRVVLGAEDRGATMRWGLSGLGEQLRYLRVGQSSAVITVRRATELAELEVVVLDYNPYQTVAGTRVKVPLRVLARGVFGEAFVPPNRALALELLSLEGGGSVSLSGITAPGLLIFRPPGNGNVQADVTPAPAVDAELVFGVVGQSSAVHVILGRATVIAAGALSTVRLTVLDPAPRQVLSGSDRTQVALQVSFAQNGPPVTDVPLILAAFLSGEAELSSVVTRVTVDRAGSLATGILELSLGPVALESTVHFDVVDLPEYVRVLRPEPLRITLAPTLSELSLSVIQGGDQQLAAQDRAVANYVLQVAAIDSDGRPFAAPWEQLNVIAALTRGSAESYVSTMLTAVSGQIGLATAELTVVLSEDDQAATLELGLSGFAARDRGVAVTHSSAVLTVRRVAALAELQLEVLVSTLHQTVVGAPVNAPIRVTARGVFGEVFVPPPGSVKLLAEALKGRGSVNIMGEYAPWLLFQADTGIATSQIQVTPAPGEDMELLIDVHGLSLPQQVVPVRIAVAAAGALSTVQLTVLGSVPRQLLFGTDRVQLALQVSLAQKGAPLADVPLTLTAIANGEARLSSATVEVVVANAGSPVTAIFELPLQPMARVTTVHFAVVGLPDYVTVLGPDPVRVLQVPVLSSLSLSVVAGGDRHLAPRGQVVADYVLQAMATGSDGQPIAVSWSDLSLVAALTGGSAESYAATVLNAVSGQVGVSTAGLRVVLSEDDRAATLELSLSGFVAGDPSVPVRQSSVVLSVWRMPGVAELTVVAAAATLQQTVAGETLRTAVTVTARGVFAEPVAPSGLVLGAVDDSDVAVSVMPTATLYFDPDSGSATALIELLPRRGVDTTVQLTVRGGGDDVTVRTAELRVGAAEVLARLEVLAPAQLRQSGPYQPLGFEVQLRATGSKGSPWQPESLILQHHTPSGVAVSLSTESLFFESGLATVVVELLPSPGEDVTVVFDVGGDIPGLVQLNPAEVLVVAAEVLSKVTLSLLGPSKLTVGRVDEQITIKGQLRVEWLGKPLTERRFTVKAFFSNPSDRTDSIYPVVVKGGNNFGSFSYTAAPLVANTMLRFDVISLPPEVAKVSVFDTVQITLVPVIESVSLSVREGQLGLLPSQGRVSVNYVIAAEVIGSDGLPFSTSFTDLRLSASLLAGSSAGFTRTAFLSAVPDAPGVATTVLKVTLGEDDRSAVLQLELISIRNDDERLGVATPLTVEILRARELAELTVEPVLTTLNQMAAGEPVQAQLVVTARGVFGEALVPNAALRLETASLEGGAEVVFADSGLLRFDDRGVATATVSITPAPGVAAELSFGVAGQPVTVQLVPGRVAVAAATVLDELSLSVVQGGDQRLAARGQVVGNYLLQARAIGSDGRPFAASWSELGLAVVLSEGSASSHVQTALNGVPTELGLATAVLTVTLGAEDRKATYELGLSGFMDRNRLVPISHSSAVVTVRRFVELAELEVVADVSTPHQTVVGERVKVPLRVLARGVFGEIFVPPDKALVVELLSLEGGGSASLTGQGGPGLLKFTRPPGTGFVQVYVTPAPAVDTELLIGVAGQSSAVRVIPTRVTVIAAGAVTTVRLTVADPSPRQVISGSEQVSVAVQVSFEQQGPPLFELPFTLAAFISGQAQLSSTVAQVTVENEGSLATGILELSLGPVARESTVHITVVGLPAYVTVLNPPPLRLVLVPELSTLSLSLVQAENRRLASRGRAVADYTLRAEATGSDGRPFAVSWSELALVATLIGGSAERYAVSSLTVVVGQPWLSTAALTVVLGAADPAAILELSLSGFAVGGRIAHSPIELTVQRVPELLELVVDTELSTLHQTVAGRFARTRINVMGRGLFGEPVVPNGGLILELADTEGVAVAFEPTASLYFDPDSGLAAATISVLPVPGQDVVLILGVANPPPGVTVVTAVLSVVAVDATTDINGDSQFDIDDAMIMLRYMNSAEDPYTNLPLEAVDEDMETRIEQLIDDGNRLDMVPDGTIDSSDIRTLIRYMAGLRDEAIGDDIDQDAAEAILESR